MAARVSSCRFLSLALLSVGFEAGAGLPDGRAVETDRALRLLDEGSSLVQVSLGQREEMTRDRSELLLGDGSSTFLGGRRVSTPSCIIEPMGIVHTGGLQFVHIPRTAGTTIESCSNAAPEDERWSSANPMFKGRIEKGWTQCYMQHVPPSMAPKLYEGKDTFCVVRDPYGRAVSQLGFMSLNWGKESPNGRQACSAEELNDYLRERLSKLYRNPYRDDCHLMPQTAYVYAWDKRSHEVNQSSRTCNHVLRYESLSEDFNRTMQERDLKFRLSWKTVSVGTRSGAACHLLSPRDLAPDVRRLIEMVYKDDFDLLGYPRLSD